MSLVGVVAIPWSTAGRATFAFAAQGHRCAIGVRCIAGSLNRLTGLLDTNTQARELPSLSLENSPEGLTIRHLTVSRPDAHTLIKDLNLSLATGDTLLVNGASGSGKTCLLRSLANLWPYTNGSVSRPLRERTLFLPQHPYIPLDSLRNALAYPRSPHSIDDAQAREVLRQVQLGHLADRIDDDGDWGRTLSPGEQQRLGFARIMLSRPQVAFLDEATSALDEGLEHALYTLVREHLPDCTLVSVGHRNTLSQMHSNYLELLGDGRWSLTVPVR